MSNPKIEQLTSDPRKIDQLIDAALKVLVEAGMIRSDQHAEAAKAGTRAVLRGLFIDAAMWSAEQLSQEQALLTLRTWSKKPS